jgi:flagellar biosynthesis protein FliR
VGQVDALFPDLLRLLLALWWPFCRIMALLSAAPVLGDGSVPVTVRLLLSLVLAVVMLPVAQPTVAIDPLSLHAVVATIEQVAIGGLLGLALHFTVSVIMVLGYLVSSQMGLAMAVMNDPLTGISSDVVSSLLSILGILVFFSVDGHLLVTQVLGASFQQWPVGSGIPVPALRTVAFSVAWVFSAALLLALPVVLATLVVQIGFGLLARVAPTLNLFALGFSVVTLFGVSMLSQLVRFLPEHYLRMSAQVLEMLRRTMWETG